MADQRYRRLERIERAMGEQREAFPWQRVCDACQREGRDSTPYERCEADQCNRAHKVTREWLEDFCKDIPQGPPTEAELAQMAALRAGLEERSRPERESWSEKKRAMERGQA